MSDVNSFIESIKNIGSLLPMIYKDLAQPGIRKVGLALEAILDTPNTLLLLLRWPNETSQAKFNNYMNTYRKKLEQIPDEKICKVPPEVGIPILERLTYITNEDIANMFVNILAKASSNETIMQAHPSFVHILDRLSSDEAKIVDHIKYSHKLEYVMLYEGMINIKIIEYPERLTGLEFELDFDFPKNIEMYLNNMTSLGLIEPKDEVKTVPRSSVFDRYNKIESLYEKQIEKMKSRNKNDDSIFSVNKKHGYYRITNFGKEFFKACTS